MKGRANTGNFYQRYLRQLTKPENSDRIHADRGRRNMFRTEYGYIENGRQSGVSFTG